MDTYTVKDKKQMLATMKAVEESGRGGIIKLQDTNFSVTINHDTPMVRLHKMVNRIKQTPQSLWSNPPSA